MLETNLYKKLFGSPGTHCNIYTSKQSLLASHLREYDFNKEIDLHWSIFTCSFAPVLGARWQCKYNMQLIIVCPKQKLKQHFSPLPHHHFSSNQKTMSTYLLFWEKPLFLWHHKHSTKQRKWIVLHHKEIFIPSCPYLERQDKGLAIM